MTLFCFPTQQQKDKKSSLWKASIAGSVLIALILLGLYYRQHSFQIWVESNSQSLTPFETVLIHNNVESTDPDVAQPIDQQLVQRIKENRRVKHLSRSNYWYSLTRQHAWVKIHLETYTETTSDLAVKINLLIDLKKTESQWEIRNIENLAIP